MTLFLYLGDKDFKEIQQIIIFIKAANLAKYVIGQIANLAMIIKKKQLER